MTKEIGKGRKYLNSVLFRYGELPKPAILAQAAIGELEAAIAELQGILQELGEESSL